MMGIGKQHRRAGRNRKVRVQDVVDVLDIDEYLGLAPAEKQKVDVLLGTVGSRKMTAESLQTLIDAFGSDSATALAVMGLLQSGGRRPLAFPD